MEKNSLIFRWLAVWLFVTATPSISAETNIPLHYRGRYAKVKDILRAFPALQYKLGNPSLVGSLRLKNKSLKFRIDSYYFAANKLVHRTRYPVIYRKGAVFLPRQILQYILLYVLNKDIVYKESSRQITLLTTSPKRKIIPEKIELKRLIIDAGHGGHDPGAVFDDKELQEKKINLQVAKLLQQYLKKRFPHLKVFMTRSDDHFVELKDRANMANRKLRESTNTIFISLHCNSAFNQNANGFEVYYLDQSHKMETSREYSIIEYKLVPTRHKRSIVWIQSGMMSTLIQRRSIRLAKSVHDKLNTKIGKQILSRGVKRANFHVLRRSLMPAILVEMGFISNPSENKLLLKPKMQIKMAEGIAEGIKLFIKTKDSQ
ncbi:MAG: N-acetylmuramoyl-L-alanine amidase [Spirochaetota bacterium]